MKAPPDSAFYWFPRVKKALPGLTPNSILVEALPGSLLASVGEGHPKEQEALSETIRRVQRAAGELQYPVFLKTDLSSAKHHGTKDMRAEGREDVARIVPALLEDNLCKELFPNGIMVRDWIDIDSWFLAFGGLPIGVEWRLFATKDRVLCQHPYWPADAIQFWGTKIGKDKEPANWRADLREIHGIKPRPDLLKAAARAVAACPDVVAWSVDVARDKKGRWWLIDMADARHSEHLRAWPGCPIPARYPAAFDDNRTGLAP